MSGLVNIELKLVAHCWFEVMASTASIKPIVIIVMAKIALWIHAYLRIPKITMKIGIIMAMIEMMTVPMNPKAQVPAEVKPLEPVMLPIQLRADPNP